MGKKKIGVSSGHNFDTPGKRTPDGVQEYMFNWPTKMFVMDFLSFNDIIPIDLNPDRYNESLEERVSRANKYGCDAVVCIHFNAMGDKWQTNAKGIETYHYPGSVEGKKLANSIHSELLKGTPMYNRGVKSAKYYMLKYTDMPAVLAECGFMDNPKEAKLMTLESYQRETAHEIAKGVCNYYGKVYKKNQTFFRVVTGSFKNLKNAEKRANDLREKGFESFIIEN